MSWAWQDNWPTASGIGALLLAIFFMRIMLLALLWARFGTTWRKLMPLSRFGEWTKRVLIVSAIGLFVLVLLRPYERKETNLERVGIDISIALDYSKSMRVDDLEPDRLTVAKDFLRDLIQKRTGDRIALTAFAGSAIFFPMTTDHVAAAKWLDEILTVDFPPGSDLNYGFDLASCLAETIEGFSADCAHMTGFDTGPEERVGELPDRRGRAVIFITDGGDPQQGRELGQRVKKARDKGQLVLIVGAGTAGGGRVPKIGPNDEVTGLLRNEAGTAFVTSALEEEFLRELATAAGGDSDHYLALVDPEVAVSEANKRLRQLQAGKLAEDTDFVNIPRDFWFLVALTLVLAFEIGVSRSRTAMLH